MLHVATKTVTMASMNTIGNGYSDIGSLWDQALKSYTTETGIKLGDYQQKTWNVFQIAMDQENQLQTFKNLRHDESRLDKARSMIAKNSEYIQKAAEMIADAASTAFPPSSGILTAITYVISTAKNVSADYDVIEAFLDVMGTFLQRLTLLEGKLPPEEAYRKRLMKVFCSLLKLCGIVQQYTKKWGRFKHWARALIEGSDDKLKGAYDDLNNDLTDLEKTTLMKTLSTVLETSEDVKKIQLTASEALLVGQDTQKTTHEIQMGVDRVIKLGTENAERNEAVLGTVHRLEMIFKASLLMKTEEPSESEDSGLRKTRGMDMLSRIFLPFETSLKPRLRELSSTYVAGTFDWIETNQDYLAFRHHKVNVLHITGADGMGKSMLCFSIFQRLHSSQLPGTLGVKSLHSSIEHELYASAACYFFDGPTTMRNLLNMAHGCCMQVAEQDQDYREMVKELSAKGVSLQQRGDLTWNLLFESMFSKDSNRRVVLLLDSINMMDEEEWEYLRDLIMKASEKNLNIQFLLTSTSAFNTGLDSLQPKCIELTKELIHDDLLAVISASLEGQTFTSLARLRRELRKKLLNSVCASADSKLYGS
jgi:hypothetical protein